MKKYLFLLLLILAPALKADQEWGNFVMCDGELTGSDTTYCALGVYYYEPVNKLNLLHGSVYKRQDGRVVDTGLDIHATFYPDKRTWGGSYNGHLTSGNYTTEGVWYGTNLFGEEGTGKVVKGKFNIWI